MEERVRVLYVEDDPGAVQTLVDTLSRDRYCVDSVPDVPTALALCTQNHYDSVLIGHLADGQSGLVLIETLQQCSGPPAIVLAAHGEEELAQQAIRADTADCLIRDGGNCYLALLPALIERALLRPKGAGHASGPTEWHRQIFDSLPDGFALHEIILNETGLPVDYRFLEMNPVFEEMLGMKRDEIVGKTVLECLPETDPFWIETYGRVALTGMPAHFENYCESLARYFVVRAYSPQRGQVATIFQRRHRTQAGGEGA